ncbi:MAG: ABC transporter ATP-binding protein [Mycobacteriales bacterium]|nr:ABC transporter ATP-binding protein [Mycobacteriales bacterium]
MTALLEAQAVTRRFGGLTAVNEVSFSVEQGSAVGLIGANGAGKTTLFNCLTGFDKPTSGDVRLRGKSLLKLPRHKVVGNGVARTFQIVKPFPDLPVLANVMVPLIVRRTKGDVKAEAMAVLQRVGLAHRAASPSSQLSEGDLKRLEMARALATGPELLLLDEPFAGLSTNEIGVLSDTIRQLKDDGVTLVIVEHKIGSLLALVDRVIAMDQGRVIADGEPEVVLRDPAVVRAYLGGDPDANSDSTEGTDGE